MLQLIVNIKTDAVMNKMSKYHVGYEGCYRNIQLHIRHPESRISIYKNLIRHLIDPDVVTSK